LYYRQDKKDSKGAQTRPHSIHFYPSSPVIL